MLYYVNISGDADSDIEEHAEGVEDNDGYIHKLYLHGKASV